MIVAITGAGGFIGRKLLARCIGDGHTVRVLTRRAAVELPPQATVCQGDLTGELPLALVENADVLYHCAAEMRNRQRMQAVNVGGTASLIKIASGRVGRWVQLSSAGAYGPRREGKVTEKTPEHPVGDYERTKASADALVSEAGAKGAFTYSILRPTIVFGAGMGNRSLYQLIAAIDKGFFFFIGKPGASANYIHAENVVDALCLCANRPAAAGHIYNLSDHHDIESFVSAIARELGKPVPRVRLPEAPTLAAVRLLSLIPGFPLTPARVRALTSRAIYPCERISVQLGYRPRVGMEAGLAELVAAWKSSR